MCRYHDKWFDYCCPNCSITSPLREGGEFICWSCNGTNDEKEIVEQINEFIITPDNYFEAHVPAHCSECEGYHSVVQYKDQYLCVICFCVTEGVGACSWCGEFGNGDMEDSNLGGCTVCAGSIGNQMSKDD